MRIIFSVQLYWYVFVIFFLPSQGHVAHERLRIIIDLSWSQQNTEASRTPRWYCIEKVEHCAPPNKSSNTKCQIAFQIHFLSASAIFKVWFKVDCWQTTFWCQSPTLFTTQSTPTSSLRTCISIYWNKKHLLDWMQSMQSVSLLMKANQICTVFLWRVRLWWYANQWRLWPISNHLYGAKEFKSPKWKKLSLTVTSHHPKVVAIFWEYLNEFCCDAFWSELVPRLLATV